MQPGDMLPTTAGTVWIILAKTGNGAAISSVSGGGGTWAHCPNCHSSNGSTGLDAFYNLSGTGGTTSITVNLSASAASFFQAIFIEVMPPPGSTPSFDTSGTASDSSCTSCTAVGLTLSATDVVVEVQAGAGTNWQSWTRPYVTSNHGYGFYVNAPPGNLPAPIMSGTGSANVVFSALAFKSSSGTFTPPTIPLAVASYQEVNAACSPSCTVSIPSTGSGNLLFIAAGGGSSSVISSVSSAGTWNVPTGANTCQIVQSGVALSCAYNLSDTSGATSLSITMSTSAAITFSIWEISSAAGPFSLDSQASATNAASLSPPGVALSMTGSTDVAFQFLICPGGIEAVTLYPQLVNAIMPGFAANIGAAVNIKNGTAPKWAYFNNAVTAASGIAFKVGS